MSKTPYVAIVGSDNMHTIEGPGTGFGYYAGTLWPAWRLSSKADAEAAALIANEAYRMGRESMRQDINDLLGGRRA